MYLLLKGGHARHKQHSCELDGALHIEVGVRKRLQKLLEGLFEERVILLTRDLWRHNRTYASTNKPVVQLVYVHLHRVACGTRSVYTTVGSVW